MPEPAALQFNPPTLERVRDTMGDRCVLRGAWNLSSLERRLGEIAGVIAAEYDVAEAEATEDIQKLGGSEALEEPYTTIALHKMVKKRASWLVVLFLGEMLTATAMTCSPVWVRSSSLAEFDSSTATQFFSLATWSIDAWMRSRFRCRTGQPSCAFASSPRESERSTASAPKRSIRRWPHWSALWSFWQYNGMLLPDLPGKLQILH